MTEIVITMERDGRKVKRDALFVQIGGALKCKHTSWSFSSSRLIRVHIVAAMNYKKIKGRRASESKMERDGCRSGRGVEVFSYSKLRKNTGEGLSLVVLVKQAAANALLEITRDSNTKTSPI